MKSLAYMVRDRKSPAGNEVFRPLLVLMRGNDQMNEAKLSAALAGREFRPMAEDEIVNFFHSPAGYLGPVGLERVSAVESNGSRSFVGEANQFIVLMDSGLKGRKNLVGGANEEGYHFTGLNSGIDFEVTDTVDLRNAVEGEGCPNCGHPLKIGKAVEIGHIFKLGYKYSEPMGARVLDEHGKEVTPIMGSYGIGLERILTSCVEQNADENGFWMPANIAPFEVVVTPTNTADEKINTGALEIAKALEVAGLDVLLDDRDERPGVKFKDADLIGVTYRINVGKKLGEGIVEVVNRAGSTREDVKVGDVVQHVKKLVLG
jgi:prolyl-tRNA synthetase